MRFQTFMRFLAICFVTNLLIACTGPGGETVSFVEWWTNSGPAFEGYDGTAPFTSLFTSIGSLLSGPFGIAAGILGTALPAYMKHKKTADGLGGMVQGIQAGRAALDEDQRLAFDTASREIMNEVKKGDPRGLVRKVKDKLKKAGKLSLERLSNKHVLIDEAKKAAKKLL